MTKYILRLNTGETKSIEAISPQAAKLKYYGSSHHYRTESMIEQISKVGTRKKRQIKRRRGSGIPLGFGFGKGMPKFRF